MAVTYDMLVVKRSVYRYTLETKAGVVMWEFSANNDSEAMRMAQAWMSSWSSVRITLKGEDGKHEEGS